MKIHTLLAFWGLIASCLVQSGSAATKIAKIAEITQEQDFHNWYVPNIAPNNLFETDSIGFGINPLTHINGVMRYPVTPFFVMGGGFYLDQENLSFKLTKKPISSLLKPTENTSTQEDMHSIVQKSGGLKGEVIYSVYKDLSVALSMQYNFTSYLDELVRALENQNNTSDAKLLSELSQPMKVKGIFTILYQVGSIFQFEVGVSYLLPFKRDLGEQSNPLEATREITMEKGIGLYFGIRLNYL